MQWDSSLNLGFSTAEASQLYLPVDMDPSAPTVEAQSLEAGSLLAQVRDLIRLRSENPALSGDGIFTSLYAEPWQYPFVYSRSKDKKTFVIAVNPSDRKVSAEFPLKDAPELQHQQGNSVEHRIESGRCTLQMGPLSYAIFEAIPSSSERPKSKISSDLNLTASITD